MNKRNIAVDEIMELVENLPAYTRHTHVKQQIELIRQQVEALQQFFCHGNCNPVLSCRECPFGGEDCFERWDEKE
jgi:hypothetical protein